MPPAPHATRLIEPWFDEIDRLSRRRTDSAPAILAVLARFETALAEWCAATGETPQAWRERLAARIGRALGAPWPSTRLRRDRLAAARDRLLASAPAPVSASRPGPARAGRPSSRPASPRARRRARRAAPA